MLLPDADIETFPGDVPVDNIVHFHIITVSHSSRWAVEHFTKAHRLINTGEKAYARLCVFKAPFYSSVCLKVIKRESVIDLFEKPLLLNPAINVLYSEHVINSEFRESDINFRVITKGV